MGTQRDLKVYYDGLCKVCSKEINHYKKQIGADRIEFVDICSDQFDAIKENLDPIQVHKIMHVRTKEGSVVTRVGAFIEIWKILPKYHWLAKLASNPIVLFGLEKGYSGFAMVRPFLPRYSKNTNCEESPYCEVKNATTPP